jgi:hypothetical protein
MTQPKARQMSGETKLSLSDFSDAIDCRLKWIIRHGHEPMDMYGCKSCGASLSVTARSARPPCQVVIARAQPEKR